jgi:hypothetical protein
VLPYCKVHSVMRSDLYSIAFVAIKGLRKSEIAVFSNARAAEGEQKEACAILCASGIILPLDLYCTVE